MPQQGAVHEFEVMALADSPVHRLDPRAKLLTTLAYVVLVMSFGRYELQALLPFALFPLAVFSLAGLPARPLLAALLTAAPFAVVVGAFNPLIDRETVAVVGGVAISGGWVSFASILVRFLLTVSAALLLVATTGMYKTGLALDRLGVPRAFVLQLLFVFRYTFVLREEAAALARAYRLRSYGRPVQVALFGRLAGNLLLRTLDRAQRVHRAMVCRGFDGTIRFLGTLRLGAVDLAFCAGWIALFALMRVYDGPALLGALLVGGAA